MEQEKFVSLLCGTQKPAEIAKSCLLPISVALTCFKQSALNISLIAEVQESFGKQVFATVGDINQEIAKASSKIQNLQQDLKRWEELNKEQIRKLQSGNPHAAQFLQSNSMAAWMNFFDEIIEMKRKTFNSWARSFPLTPAYPGRCLTKMTTSYGINCSWFGSISPCHCCGEHYCDNHRALSGLTYHECPAQSLEYLRWLQIQKSGGFEVEVADLMKFKNEVGKFHLQLIEGHKSLKKLEDSKESLNKCERKLQDCNKRISAELAQHRVLKDFLTVFAISIKQLKFDTKQFTGFIPVIVVMRKMLDLFENTNGVADCKKKLDSVTSKMTLLCNNQTQVAALCASLNQGDLPAEVQESLAFL